MIDPTDRADSEEPWAGLPFVHVDVFADRPFTGNGLVVVLDADRLSERAMLAITQEMRQFETIFLSRLQPRSAAGRVFTVEEELDFAGHPLLGAAAVMHRRLPGAAQRERLRIDLSGRELSLRSDRHEGRFEVELDQGPPTFGRRLDAERAASFAVALGLDPADLDPALLAEVVSTGLPYLLLPVARGLERARISVEDLERRLDEVGAKFVYVLDPDAREGRTWDNAGAVEDVATGSAAGPAAAYLVRHGRAPAGERFAISQGRFVGRPSLLRVRVAADAVHVGGAVTAVAEGRFAER